MINIDKEFSLIIHQTLQGVLSPDKALIDQAQQQLKVLQIRPEYSLVLVNILIDQSIDFGIRQLAGVLFKQFVEVYWSKNSEKFQEPEVDANIKLRVKELLPLGLNDANSKIRSAVAYAVAIVAHWDWPEQWPQLFGILINALNGIGPTSVPTNNSTVTLDLNAVHGALETLTEIVQEVTDIQMPQVAPAIIPQLYKIFIDPQNYSINLRTRAIEIFTSLVNVIAEMADYDSTASKKYLNPYLPDFIFSMIKVLSLPSHEVNLVNYSLKKEIIKTLSALLKSFPKKLSNSMNDILTQIWSCLVQSSEVYVNKVVNSDTQGEAKDLAGANDTSDFEDEKSAFENLVYQLFDFILTLKEKNRYKATIKKAIDELCYYAILFIQITDDQIENWTNNPEQFVQDEDEETYSYSVRISATELIESIGNEFEKETATAICKVISRHMEHAQKMRASNDQNWWKLYESCLLAISCAKDTLKDMSANNELEFDLNSFFNQFVVGCLHESNFPFLVGRALFTASKFPKLLNNEILETLLKATGSALQDNQNPIIRVSAMKSTYCFCVELSNENQQKIISPHLAQLTDGLIQMITQNSTNEIGTLTMETLIIVLSIDEQFVATVESKVSPLAIALFLKNTNDPLVNSIICDMLKKLITNPYTNSKIEQRLMPTLISIINTSLNNKLGENNSLSEQRDFSSLLTSTLDLITTTVRSSSQIPLSDITMNAFIHVINLCLKSDDTAVLQSGGECLRAYISKAIDQLINWKDEKGLSALNYIVLVINHMLDPKTSENGCSFIGKLIITLIKQTANILGDNLDAILKSVLSKMQSSNILLVQQSLIMVFAHLIHTRLDAVLSFLSNLPGPTGQPVLEFLMTEWVAKQNSFVGGYESKISILALAKLLEHAISTEDKRFQNIFVKGDRIINPVEGIKTRSKSKEELYTQVPLLVKIYKLLINEMYGLIEEKKEDEEEYEDDDEGEYDEDDEEVGLDEDKDNIEVDENGSEGAESANKYLNKYDIFEDAFDKDDTDDDPDALEDPMYKIDLLEFLKNYIQTLSRHPCYKLFSEHHNNMERDVLKEIGIANV